MKRNILTALVVALALLGGWFGWRFYQDAWLPDRELETAREAQEALFEAIKPPALQTRETAAPEEPPATAAPDAAAAPETTEAPPPADPLAELRAVNPEAVGWITIEGTHIDYPIVQAEDNSFYLKKGFDRQENAGLGCPFLDYRCENGFTGFNSVVYGHDIPSKQLMFTDIANYKDSGYLRDHPRGLLLTGDGVREVLFFAYLTVPLNSSVYEISPITAEEQAAYIDGLFEAAVYSSGFTAEELKQTRGLRLLLLSTCTYEYSGARGVLVGVIQ